MQMPVADARIVIRDSVRQVGAMGASDTTKYWGMIRADEAGDLDMSPQN